MNKPKLERCPHCGGNAMGWHRDEDGAAFVKCDDCNAKSGFFLTEESARDAWNRRAPLPDNKALTVDELRKAADCGIPVWLVGVEAKNQWVRINYVESLTIGFSAFGDAETWSFCAKRYGKTVLAYLRPPEKGE